MSSSFSLVEISSFFISFRSWFEASFILRVKVFSSRYELDWENSSSDWPGLLLFDFPLNSVMEVNNLFFCNVFTFSVSIFELELDNYILAAPIF